MNKDDQSKRLTSLRTVMKGHDVAAYLVPHADEFQNEYTPPCAERLRWISGFDGSAGMAVVGITEAAIFVDGRYTLQVKGQADAKFWHHFHLVNDPAELWLQRQLSKGDRVGFDPRLYTPSRLSRLKTVLKNSGVELVAIENNLIDMIWLDRPASPLGHVCLHPEIYNGETAANKRQDVAKMLQDDGMDAVVITSPDNLAWLMNLRGQDLEFTPTVLGHAILHEHGKAELFIDLLKLSATVKHTLKSEGVLACEPDQFAQALMAFKGQKVRLERDTANVFIHEILQTAGAIIDVGVDPCTPAKAIKNTTEIEGMKQAHIRDGVALAQFFNWFRDIDLSQESEWTVSQKLAKFRERNDLYQGPSFPTISATGANGAIVHYGLDRDHASPLKKDQLYLVDSGGQYLDGTTDVTRVVMNGTPTKEIKRRYTQVLKGHIAVSRAKFPVGTTGAQIDPLARQFLWADGVDYDHGTGHGVGSYLSVHEGPQSISKRGTEVELKPGMVLSIEPGFYKTGAFGIRIENLAVVIKIPNPSPGADKSMLGFEPLTLAPYDRRLMEMNLLNQTERDWINDYHAKVFAAIAPLLNDGDVNLLAQETKPLP